MLIKSLSGVEDGWEDDGLSLFCLSSTSVVFKRFQCGQKWMVCHQRSLMAVEGTQ